MTSDVRGDGEVTAPRSPLPGAGEDRTTPCYGSARRAERARHAAYSRRPEARRWQPAMPPHLAKLAPVDAEDEFSRAMRDYCQASGRLFPTWSEVLEVLQSLGYRRFAPAGTSDDLGTPPWPRRGG